MSAKKKCTKCGVTKPLEAFAKDRKTPDELRYFCRKCDCARTEKWRKKNPGAARLSHAKWKAKNPGYWIESEYGLSLLKFKKLKLLQKGVCKICKQKCSLKRELSVDHCHATGKVRGLLCNSCNTGLGNFKDSPALLAEASKYLQE